MPKLKWLLTVKIIRIVDGFKSLDINSFMKIIRKQLNRYTNWRIQRNPILADDINLDQINITFQMKLNYCLKSLHIKGLIKIKNFNKNPKKLNYLYLLTPKGISAKTKLTVRFMNKKLLEYDELKKELDRLKK